MHLKSDWRFDVCGLSPCGALHVLTRCDSLRRASGRLAQKDKQCKSTADDAALITWDIADIPATYNWKVKDTQPIATRSFRLLALKDGVYTGSMGTKECSTPETCVWSGDKFVGKDAPADKFVKVSPYDGLESGIVVAAVILSIVSVAILLGYFVYERLVVAKRE